MWAVPRELPQLYREFNGIDFGHAHLAQTLLRTQNDDEVEKARLEVLDFIYSSPAVPPDEEQVAPELVRLVWEVQRSFNWTHELHRSIYDIYASDKTHDKDTAIKKVVADYLSKPEAITPHHLDHHGKLWNFTESKAFRDRYPKFNSQIWAYHWLQGATYDVQLMGDAAKQRELMPRLIKHYHTYLKTPPVEWQSMPMFMETAPEFAMKHPDAAAIFDNLHMLHDNLDDVLSRPDLFATRKEQRARILQILDIYLHRNHAHEDKFADYHMPMSGGMGSQHGKGMQMAQSAGQDHQQGEKGHSAQTNTHAALKDDIAPGKDHTTASHEAKQNQKDVNSSSHGERGHEMKPKAGHDMMQAMMNMPPPPGPRPPSAKDVLEGRTGNKNTEGDGKSGEQKTSAPKTSTQGHDNH